MEDKAVNAEVAAKYDHTTEALKEVATLHADKKVTDENYDEAKAVLKDIKSLESAIEARRVELKAFYLEGGRAVDARAKELKAIILPTIESLKSQIAEIDQKEKEDKIRRERAADLPVRKEKCEKLGISKTDDELLLMPDVQFLQMIQEAQAQKLAEAQRIIDEQNAARIAAENEQKRAAELEAAKAEAAERAKREAEQEAQRKVEEAERKAAQAEETARKEHEAKLKREAEEKEAQEKKIRDSGDGAMVNHWIQQMLSVPRPQLADGSLYSDVVGRIVKALEKEIR